MNTLLTATAILATAMGSALAAPETGKLAPGFSAVDTRNATVTLDDLRGKVVVLEWSNHDCPFVRKHYDSGNMQATQKAAVASGAVWITIVSSAPGQQGYVDVAAANALTTTRKATPSHVILDPTGNIGRLYGAKTTPHMFVIDKTGTLQYQGAIDSMPTAKIDDIARAENYVSAALDSIAGGRAVVTRQTQPYGCSVKYAS